MNCCLEQLAKKSSSIILQCSDRWLVLQATIDREPLTTALLNSLVLAAIGDSNHPHQWKLISFRRCFPWVGNRQRDRIEPVIDGIELSGRISGSMGFVPFMPRENKGIGLLDYLLLDLNLDIDVNKLKSIDLFLLNFPDVHVNGKGAIDGRLHFRQGWVQAGTNLEIDAGNLAVTAMSQEIEGDGAIGLRMGPETDGLLDLAFRFRDLQVTHREDSRPFLTGKDLTLNMGGDGRLIPDPGKRNMSHSISLEIEGLTVPDLSLLQRHIPAKWPFQVYRAGGRNS
jgi:hypothetical protein